MPAKYIFDYPALVKSIGMAHFNPRLIYMVTMVVAFWRHAVAFTGWLRTILAGLVPLGTFFNDQYLRSIDGKSLARLFKATS